MSLILGPDGKPAKIGGAPSFVKQALQHDQEMSSEDEAFIDWVRANRKPVDMGKVETAIAFWKNVYFSVLVDEKRLLNGIEAYELGDPAKHEKPNPAPYIAMCNLMALEGLRKLGQENPSTTNPHRMLFGSDREQEIAGFWKNSFAPTLFQCEWAWSAILGLIGGNPVAIREMLTNYKEQLP